MSIEDLPRSYWLHVFERRTLIEITFDKEMFYKSIAKIPVTELKGTDPDEKTYHMKLLVGDNPEVSSLHETDELISINNINVQSIGLDIFKKMLGRCDGKFVIIKVLRFIDKTDSNNVSMFIKKIAEMKLK